MSASEFYSAERDRLRALAAYSILDTPDEPAYTALADSAARLLGASGAAITLLDASRQWQKASHGPALRQTPRAWSLCAEVVHTEAPLVVPDLRADAKHASNPFSLGPDAIRSYAGVPLIGRDGLPLGALSVSDHEPRLFTDADLATLSALAAAVVALLEQRRNDSEAGRLARPPAPLGLDDSNFSAAGIRRALRRGEIEVHFQPIVSIPDGVITGLEALSRWRVPGIGLIPPQFFLPFVESSPLLSQSFTEHVLRTACDELAAWQALGADDLRMSVNVSGYDVTCDMLPSMVNAAVRRSGISYDSLTLEITETVNLHNRELAISHLNQIRDLGVRVTLDDFGVGYSSLEYAGMLPVSGLKLDRNFVAGLQGSPGMGVALDTVVQLCRRLGLELVAEGVETQEVSEVLSAAGVKLAQGYYFSRPVQGERIGELIAAQPVEQRRGALRLPQRPADCAPAQRQPISA